MIYASMSVYYVHMYTLQAVACLTGHVDHVAKSHGTVLWSSYHGVYQLMGILNSMKMEG